MKFHREIPVNLFCNYIKYNDKTLLTLLLKYAGLRTMGVYYEDRFNIPGSNEFKNKSFLKRDIIKITKIEQFIRYFPSAFHVSFSYNSD
jgi:hypothetical protein